MAKDAVLLKWCGAEPWKQGHDTLAPAVQVDDSVAFAREMRKRHAPSIPCISAGQSMGGPGCNAPGTPRSGLLGRPYPLLSSH